MQRPLATLNLPEYKIKELHLKGFIFCEDINIDTIKSDVGISPEEWIALTTNTETKTALDLCEDETVGSHIVTFSSSVDEILGGGVPIKMITAFSGLPGSGKTQLCLQLCVSVQLPDCFGGIEGHAIYIDTNYGFTPQRIEDIAKGSITYCQLMSETYNSYEMIESFKTLTIENILNGIHFIEMKTFFELLASMNMLKIIINKDPKIKLIVIDNISDTVKTSNLDYFERIKVLYSFISELQQLAIERKFAIVMTNNMTTKFDESGGSYLTPSLGDSFAHRINCSILLERKTDIIFNATVNKSVLNQNKTAAFQILEPGIRDLE